MEALLAQRLSSLAESYNMLPNTQMGNRPKRSTETALELLTEQIHTVWRSKQHIASVLSLDISGAFDTVNHTRLLDNLYKKRVPMWFIKVIESFLANRTTTLVIDGEETTPLLTASRGPTRITPFANPLPLLQRATTRKTQPTRTVGIPIVAISKGGGQGGGQGGKH